MRTHGWVFRRSLAPGGDESAIHTSETFNRCVRASMIIFFTSCCENDTDGRMAILMVTGCAQGPLRQRVTEKRCQTVTRTMPYLQQEKRDTLRDKSDHIETPLNSTLVVLSASARVKTHH